ncbi:MAG TPA: glycosyltransferase family 1 protein [Candidatus Limnocylindria bacterium]|nr:glycosyltransferase family 1 protein [Candidatus Limnocylindria bacterium]
MEITGRDYFRPVRVVFDARHLQTVARVRGIGRYSRNLLAAFARSDPKDIEWTLLRLRNFPRADPQPLPAHRDLATLRFRRPELSMLALDPLLLPLELPFARPRVYHSVQLSLPAVRSFAAVVTVHDLAPLRWPEHYLRTPWASAGHRWQYALAARADAIIAPSRATKDDVVARLGVPEERVHVIPEAVDSDFAPPPREDAKRMALERFGAGRYVLYVGQFDPRKNMDALLRAFTRAGERDPELRLVIVGQLGKLATFLHEALARAGTARERVVVTGHVDEATLATLYAGAECLLHASLLEGFGLTPLESLAAGTPVVAYRAGAVEEVVADAGVLVDEGDADALGDALVRYLGDGPLQAALRARARPRAAEFSWDRAAQDTLALYRAVS